MKKSLIFVWVLLMVVPIASWGSHSTDRSYHKNYKRILKEWTRDDESYSWDGFEARLVWYATYFSSDFREAKVDRYAKLYQLTEDEVDQMKTKEMAENEKYDCFFVSIYAGSRVHPDIGKNRSLWKLVLETSEGYIVEPEIWEEIPKDQVTRTLFPYIDRWSRLFEVKFPKRINSSTARAKLKMVGVPADSMLEWKFKPSRHSSL